MPKAIEAGRPTLKRKGSESVVDGLLTSFHESDQNPEDETFVVDSESDSDFSMTDSRPQKISKVDTPKKAAKKSATTSSFPVKKHRKRANYSTEKLYTMLDKRDLDFEKAKWHLNKLQARFDELEAGKLANSRTAIDKKNIKLGELKDKEAAKSSQIKELKDKMELLNETLREQESAIVNFQKQSLPKLDQSDFIVDPDDAVGSKISKLFRSTKRFSGNYSKSDWAALDLHAQAIALASLQDSTLPKLVSGTEAVAAIQHGRLHPKVVANALLNRFLTEKLLATPFTIVAQFDSTDASSVAAEAMCRVYAMSCKVPTTAAHFRCSSASSLLSGDRGSHNSDDYELLDAKTETFARATVVSALEILSSLLNPNESLRKQSEDDLLRIIQEFIRASIRVHAQYPYTRAAYQVDLKHESFTTTHDRMQAHPAMRLKDDGDDGEGSTSHEAGVEGRPPDLIIEPLILRSGDGDGKNWEVERVIHRAQIWVFNPDEPNKAVIATVPPSARNKTQTAKVRGPRTSSHGTEAVDSHFQTRGHDVYPHEKSHKVAVDQELSPTIKIIRKEPKPGAIRIKQEQMGLPSNDLSQPQASPPGPTTTDSKSANQSATAQRQTAQSVSHSRPNQQINRAVGRSSRATQKTISGQHAPRGSSNIETRRDRISGNSSSFSRSERYTISSRQSGHDTQATSSRSNSYRGYPVTSPLNDSRRH